MKFTHKLTIALFILSLLIGCDKVEIIGSVTINGQEYQETRYSNAIIPAQPSTIVVWTHYGIIGYIAFLSPVKNKGASYDISFFIKMDKNKLEEGCHYKIEYNNLLETQKLLEDDIIKILFEDKIQLLPNNGDGVAFIEERATYIRTSLEGILSIEDVDVQTGFCSGKYTLSTLDGAKELFVICGKFKVRIENIK